MKWLRRLLPLPARDPVIADLIAAKGVRFERDANGRLVARYRFEGFDPGLREHAAWRREQAERHKRHGARLESGGSSSLRVVK